MTPLPRPGRCVQVLVPQSLTLHPGPGRGRRGRKGRAEEQGRASGLELSIPRPRETAPPRPPAAGGQRSDTEVAAALGGSLRTSFSSGKEPGSLRARQTHSLCEAVRPPPDAKDEVRDTPRGDAGLRGGGRAQPPLPPITPHPSPRFPFTAEFLKVNSKLSVNSFLPERDKTKQNKTKAIVVSNGSTGCDWICSGNVSKCQKTVSKITFKTTRGRPAPVLNEFPISLC